MKIDKFSNNLYIQILTITILIIAIYGQTYQFDYALDDHLITEVIPAKENGLKGIQLVFEQRYNEIDYRPITILSFYLEQVVFGQSSARNSHLGNVFLYILLAISILLFLRSLPFDELDEKWILFAIVLLFICHPIHANVVSNIKSRDNILSFLFLTWALFFIVLLAKSESKKIIFTYLVLSFAFYTLGYFSKRDAFTYVFLAPATLLFIQPKKWRIALLILPIVLIGINHFNALAALFAPVAENSTNGFVRYPENPLANSTQKMDRFVAATHTFYHYIKLLVIPKGYYFYYGYDQITVESTKLKDLFLPLVVSISYITLLLYCRKNKLITYGSLFLLFGLSYCLNFVEIVAGIIADRYAFIGSLGYCILVVGLLFMIVKNRKATVLISILLILGFSTASFIRAKKWASLEQLIAHDIQYLDKSHEAQRIAASTYLNASNEANTTKDKLYYLSKATQHIKKSNFIYPNNSVTQFLEAKILLDQGMIKEAIPPLEKAIAVDLSKSIIMLETAGDSHYQLKNFNTANFYYHQAYKKDSLNQILINKISTVLFEDNRADELLQFNDSIIQASPQFYAPYENLGYYYYLMGDLPLSKQFFDTAIQSGLPEADVKNIPEF